MLYYVLQNEDGQYFFFYNNTAWQFTDFENADKFHALHEAQEAREEIRINGFKNVSIVVVNVKKESVK